MYSTTKSDGMWAFRGPPRRLRRRRLAIRPTQRPGALVGHRRGPRLLGAPRASRRETPCEPGRHHGKIARELRVVAILRATLVELRHRLRHREAGQPLAVRIFPGTKQALVQLTHVLQQDTLVFRPLSRHTYCRGDVLWGHSILLPRWRRPRPEPPDKVGSWH